MGIYKRILVPVDGSATSIRGLEEALKFAREGGTRLRVLNVVDEGMTPAMLPLGIGRAAKGNLVRALKASGARALKAAAAAAARQQVKVECVQHMSGAHAVSSAIVREARRWRADLLIMGTHGCRPVHRLIIGSDAERVLHDSPIPILLVRAEPEWA